MARTYTKAQLLRAYQWARANPSERARIDYGETMTGAEWRAWFRRCLADKINRGHAPRGRKDSPDWLFAVVRMRYKLAARCVVRAQECPRELRARLAHRLHD